MEPSIEDNIIICHFCGDLIHIQNYELHVYACETNIRNLIDLHQVNQYNQLNALAERLGNVEIGINPDLVSKRFLDKKKEITCAICLEENIQSKRRLLCNHEYCSRCITKWLKKSKKCPMCFQDLENFFIGQSTEPSSSIEHSGSTEPSNSTEIT